MIELSIVLIIIGLLVGGILAGRDLIQQAGLLSVSQDVQAHKTRLNTFQLTYNALPGDMEDGFLWFGSDCGINTFIGFSATACNGNGDNLIESNSETELVWRHLAFAELIEGQYVNRNEDAREEPGVDLPAGPLNGAFSFVDPIGTGFLPAGNGFTFVGERNATVGHRDGPVLSPVDARSIDLKLDDGSAQSGRVLGGNAIAETGAVMCNDQSAPGGAFGEYLLDVKDELRCWLYFDLE